MIKKGRGNGDKEMTNKNKSEELEKVRGEVPDNNARGNKPNTAKEGRERDIEE